MLDYLDTIRDNDWMTKILCCPNCGGGFRFLEDGIECLDCGEFVSVSKGIPLFKEPPSNKKEYFFEMKRYENIALNPPETYYGFEDSYPNIRVKLIKAYLRYVTLYLNIGQGFGQLEASMPSKAKICLDQCLAFLRHCQSRNILNTRYVMGFGERMPFKDDYFPAVISDSVFQTLVDQREFLIENARVLKPNGLFLLGITYRWNYPRKPQDFPAKNSKLLISFLHELGIKAKVDYINLAQKQRTTYEEGDFLLIEGVKK